MKRWKHCIEGEEVETVARYFVVYYSAVVVVLFTYSEGGY